MDTVGKIIAGLLVIFLILIIALIVLGVKYRKYKKEYERIAALRFNPSAQVEGETKQKQDLAIMDEQIASSRTGLIVCGVLLGVVLIVIIGLRPVANYVERKRAMKV